MKKNDLQKLRDLSAPALQKKLDEMILKREKMRIKRLAGKLENTSMVKNLSKDIAVIKTLLREMQLIK
ncbi:MAG: 50S ribosomal protein L29 [Patescibacteria group bacterium]